MNDNITAAGLSVSLDGRSVVAGFVLALFAQRGLAGLVSAIRAMFRGRATPSPPGPWAEPETWRGARR